MRARARSCAPRTHQPGKEYSMKHSVKGLVMALALVPILTGLARAQDGTRPSPNGAVVDAGGGVIPGAPVVVKNALNGTTTSAVTNTQGTFNIPALEPGNYSVTVSLSGFKTAVIPNVPVSLGNPASIKATL